MSRLPYFATSSRSFGRTKRSYAVVSKTCGKTVTAGTPPSRLRNANSRLQRNLMPE
jgi:hypothetical protein